MSNPRLPRCQVVLHCVECNGQICELDVNVQSVASKLMEARKWHAIHVHAWRPAQPPVSLSDPR